MNVFKESQKYFTKEIIEEQIIKSIEEKIYLYNERFIKDFIDKLYEKKYINKKSYNELLGLNEIEMKEDKNEIYNEDLSNVKEVIKEIEEEYFDYENININGYIYYLHKENMHLVDSEDYEEMGHWDKNRNVPIWRDEDTSMKHQRNIR